MPVVEVSPPVGVPADATECCAFMAAVVRVAESTPNRREGGEGLVCAAFARRLIQAGDELCFRTVSLHIMHVVLLKHLFDTIVRTNWSAANGGPWAVRAILPDEVRL